MKLSEAIRLGSLLVEKPRAMDTTKCAIGMAILASGGALAYRQCETDWQTDNYHEFRRLYPWLYDFSKPSRKCPSCDLKTHGSETVHHVFDNHVMTGEITIEQLADFIASIEPQAPAAVEQLVAVAQEEVLA